MRDLILEVFALIIVASHPVFGEELDLSKKLDEILGELRDIRILLESTAPKSNPSSNTATTTVSMKLSGTPLGSNSAPFTIVEFSDYGCPYCRRFFRQTFADIKKNYIDSNKVRYFLKAVPIRNHPHAEIAALAVRCAGDQGQYWAMHNRVRGSDEVPGKAALLLISKELAINIADFTRCLELEKYKEDLQLDRKEAEGIGVRGTPTFLIGRSTVEGVEGEIILGAVPFAVIEGKLRQLMGTVKQ